MKIRHRIKVLVLLTIAVVFGCQQERKSGAPVGETKRSTGSLDEWPDSYFNEYINREIQFESSANTPSKWKSYLGVQYDTVYLVTQTHWFELPKDMGDLITRVARTISPDKPEPHQGEVLVLLPQWEVHFVDQEKPVLRIDFPYDESTLEIFDHDFKIADPTQLELLLRCREEFESLVSGEQRSDDSFH